MRRNKPIATPVYRSIIAERFKELKPKRCLEIGVYSGKLTKMLAAQPWVERYVIVDPWEAPYMHYNQWHMDKIAYEVARWAAKHKHVEVLRLTSEAAEDELVEEWGTFDWAHADGDHSYEGTSLDIRIMLNMVKVGAPISGDSHDLETVARAVRDCLPDATLLGKGRIWWYAKQNPLA